MQKSAFYWFLYQNSFLLYIPIDTLIEMNRMAMSITGDAYAKITSICSMGRSIIGFGNIITIFGNSMARPEGMKMTSNINILPFSTPNLKRIGRINAKNTRAMAPIATVISSDWAIYISLILIPVEIFMNLL